MTLVAVLNRSSADSTDVAFWAEAANQQALEVARVWGVESTPVVFFASADDLPDCRILSILDSIDVPGALGDHSDDGGIVLAEVKFTGPGTSITISHEVIEEMVDPTVNRWAPYDASHEQAVEPCDRVEGDSYTVSATVAPASAPSRAKTLPTLPVLMSRRMT